MKPSKFHNNRRFHNWLVYNIGDKCLKKYEKYYKGHLVDLGCGEAPYKEFFLQHADSYTGVDWTKTLHNSQADIVSDLNKKIEMKDNNADTLVSLSVIEHLSEPQIFLNEAYRVLKKGGYFILQVPWQWQIHEAPHDFFRYTPHGLKYIFEKAGFEILEIIPISGFFSTSLTKINYFSSRFIRGPKLLKLIIKTILIPFWTINQIIAPLLDKLDRAKDKETMGYFVLAKKNK